MLNLAVLERCQRDACLLICLCSFASLGEGEEEATCNADEGCWGSQESRGSLYTHSEIKKTHTQKKRRHRHTHSALPKKSQSHYSPDGFLLSLLSVHSFTPFTYFFSTQSPSQKILALKHISFECTAALGWIVILLSKFKQTSLSVPT